MRNSLVTAIKQNKMQWAKIKWKETARNKGNN